MYITSEQLDILRTFTSYNDSEEEIENELKNILKYSIEHLNELKNDKKYVDFIAINCEYEFKNNIEILIEKLFIK